MLPNIDTAKGSYIPHIVQKMLREEDKVIGHLTDHHVQWLTKFAMIYFDTRRVSMAFDFHSIPKKIYVTPRTPSGGVFPFKQWMLHKIKMFTRKHERDMPSFIGLSDFVITFCRTPKLGTDVEEIPNEETADPSPLGRMSNGVGPANGKT